MQTRSFRLRFVTPAFLGNADQDGQWRTPPIKALLRQFWRMAYAAAEGFNIDVATMRREEGRLFGHAWLEDDKDARGRSVAARKSSVRIRLHADRGQAWTDGTQKGVHPLPDGPDTSYAWFGLVKRGRGQADRTAIRAEKAESTRRLELAFPESVAARMDEVIALIDAFGLLGSRSRGGWGALQVEGSKTIATDVLPGYARDLGDCLRHDWAMSLARDGRGLLVWESNNSFRAWADAMRFIARHRQTVRKALKEPEDLRPALGFAGTGRMPSPLRWKVFADQKGRLKVRVFAMPHRLPEDSGRHLATSKLHSAWTTATNTLDIAHELQRIR